MFIEVNCSIPHDNIKNSYLEVKQRWVITKKLCSVGICESEMLNSNTGTFPTLNQLCVMLKAIEKSRLEDLMKCVHTLECIF